MTNNALDIQVGGNHYKQFKIQPIEFSQQFALGLCEGSIVKYIVRFPFKNGVEDLKKVTHYADLLKQFNKPVGKLVSLEYIEHFCHVNNLRHEVQVVIEELAMWIATSRAEHLTNLKLEIDALIAEYN